MKRSVNLRKREKSTRISKNVFFVDYFRVSSSLRSFKTFFASGSNVVKMLFSRKTEKLQKQTFVFRVLHVLFFCYKRRDVSLFLTTKIDFLRKLILLKFDVLCKRVKLKKLANELSVWLNSSKQKLKL
jgi:hypothetical protein